MLTSHVSCVSRVDIFDMREVNWGVVGVEDNIGVECEVGNIGRYRVFRQDREVCEFGRDLGGSPTCTRSPG